jgi:hypothetical protein
LILEEYSKAEETQTNIQVREQASLDYVITSYENHEKSLIEKIDQIRDDFNKNIQSKSQITKHYEVAKAEALEKM